MAAASGELIVRHLLMPGHLDCCTRPVLTALARHVPDATVNLMTGYRPFQLLSSGGTMAQSVSEEERSMAVTWLGEAGFIEPLLDGIPLGEMLSRSCPSQVLPS